MEVAIRVVDPGASGDAAAEVRSLLDWLRREDDLRGAPISLEPPRPATGGDGLGY
jgi:hypothetical protein